MKKHVVVYKPLPPELLLRLKRDYQVSEFARIDATNRTAFREALCRAEGAIGAGVTMDAETLAGTDRLRILSTVSVGFDSFDLACLRARGILLTHTPDVLTETVADLVFALILAAARRIVETAAYVKAGNWRGSVPEAMFGTDVHHRTLGLLGMGRIGLAVARRAALGFGMRVIYDDHKTVPRAERDFGAERRSFADVLAEADVVVVLLPLRPENEHLIDARAFARMKPTAIFVNAARGRVVDEVALVAALRDGRIRAAGLDVFEKEPLPADSPLLSLANVVAVPHIGSATRETREAMAAMAVDDLIAGLEGRKPAHLVDESVWKG